MSFPFHALEMFHGNIVDYKDHLMNDHNTRDMLPCVVVVFRERGPVPLSIDRAIHLVGPDAGLTPLEIIRATIEGAVSSGEEVLAWAQQVATADATTSKLLHVRGLGVASMMMVRGPSNDDDELVGIWVATDDYVMKAEHLTDPMFLMDGALEKDFKENPATTVVEALCTYAFSNDLCGGIDVQSIVHRYNVGDDQKLNWWDAVEEEPFRLAPGDDLPMMLGDAPNLIAKIALERIAGAS